MWRSSVGFQLDGCRSAPGAGCAQLHAAGPTHSDSDACLAIGVGVDTGAPDRDSRPGNGHQRVALWAVDLHTKHAAPPGSQRAAQHADA